MDLLKRLFGGAKKPDPVVLSPPDKRPATQVAEVGAVAVKRRDLVRTLTREVQRSCGIPDAWIEPHVVLELTQGAHTLLHLRIGIRHWDERLLRYAVAFERRLRGEIGQYEPDVRQWLHSITWQYEVGESCPYPSMPDAASWLGSDQRDGQLEPQGQPKRQSQSQPPSRPPQPLKQQQPEQSEPGDEDEDQVRADLARLFAVRDADLTEPAWQQTNLSPLPGLGASDRKTKP